MLRTLTVTFSVMTLAEHMLETIEWVAQIISDLTDCPVSTKTGYLFSWAQLRSYFIQQSASCKELQAWLSHKSLSWWLRDRDNCFIFHIFGLHSREPLWKSGRCARHWRISVSLSFCFIFCSSQLLGSLPCPFSIGGEHWTLSSTDHYPL